MDGDSRVDETDPLLPKHQTDLRRRQNRDASSPGRETSNSSTRSGRADLSPGHPPSSKGPTSNHSESDSEPLSAEEIYTLLGMSGPTPSGTEPSHLESAHGFYGQLIQKDRSISRQYRLYDMLIIALMVLQLCISAVFIVLGSLRDLDSHVAVAALGAVSTVVAGVLALLKGQGLPNRLRMERDGLRRVLFETEELYWDVRAGREVAFEDVERLRGAYACIVDDARKNHPDVWTASPVPVRAKPAGKMKATVPVEAPRM